MNTSFTKDDFQNLDFDTRCIIIESLMPDEYYNGQEEINFYIPEDYKGEFGEDLPPTPSEIEKIENEKFALLIGHLTDKLFSENEKIEFDLEQE